MEATPDPSPSDVPPSDHRFCCPGCGQEVEVPADSIGQLVRCANCGRQFFASAEAVDQHVVDDTSEAQAAAEEREQEIDGTKIRQLSAMRRGAIRARSWCLIVVVVCLVGAVELVIKTIENVRHVRHWGLRPTGFILFAVAGVMIAVYFFRRARELKREIDKPALQDPPRPPDFSTLSDGSQRWKHLEDIR
jgi:DNA-directed RNA polymerase subunit M/transcription elongation factor TFIIS